MSLAWFWSKVFLNLVLQQNLGRWYFELLVRCSATISKRSGSCWFSDNIKLHWKSFWCNLGSYCCCHTTYKQKTKNRAPPSWWTTLRVLHSLYSWHYCLSITWKWYITRHYTYFYIFSTVVGKVSSFGWTILCHWRGLRLQLDSPSLEGDGVTCWCCLSSCSGSSDRKQGNVCARGIKVIDRPVPVERRGQRVNGAHLGCVYLFNLTGPLVITICLLFLIFSRHNCCLATVHADSFTKRLM